MKRNKANKKKLVEKGAVEYFLKSQGIIFDENDCVLYPEEPADIIYKGEKFQITKAPAEVEEVVGRLDKEEQVKSGNTEGKWVKYGQTRTKAWQGGYNTDESFIVFVINPIENKLRHYGNKSTPLVLKDINLLIYSPNTIVIPWNKQVYDNFIKENFDYFRKTGFKSIHLLDQEITIKIYPL